jgi:hypothetical protein
MAQPTAVVNKSYLMTSMASNAHVNEISINKNSMVNKKMFFLLLVAVASTKSTFAAISSTVMCIDASATESANERTSGSKVFPFRILRIFLLKSFCDCKNEYFWFRDESMLTRKMKFILHF